MDNHAEGQQKPIRLVKLSADYTPEGIRHRLVNNRYDRPPRIDYRHYRPKQYKLPTCGDRIPKDKRNIPNISVLCVQAWRDTQLSPP